MAVILSSKKCYAFTQSLLNNEFYPHYYSPNIGEGHSVLGLFINVPITATLSYKHGAQQGGAFQITTKKYSCLDLLSCGEILP
jgi:hypothetical protein